MTHQIAILVYNGADVRQVAAAYSVLYHAAQTEAGQPRCRVLTIARTKEMLTLDGGLQIMPDHIYPDAQIYDALFVPGGPGQVDEIKMLRLMDWINKASRFCQVVAAAAEGNFMLGTARLLNGRSVANVPGLATAYPSAKPVSDQIVVSDGKLLTAARGQDTAELSLAILQRLAGPTAAEQARHSL